MAAALSVALVGFLLGGCAPSNTGVPINPPVYYESLNEWTRSARITDDMETSLFITATLKSKAFRQAYVAEYSKRFELDKDLKELLEKRESEVGEQYVEFFVAAYTPLDEWNDFERTSSIWRLYLSDEEARRVEPLDIEKLDARDAIFRELFPYLDPWSSAYAVKFPLYSVEGTRMDKAEVLTLTVAGIKGRGELVWKLADNETK